MSNIYHWQRPELVKRCSEWQLSAEGSVRELRERLTAYVRSCLVAEMETKPVGVETARVEVGAMNSELSQGVRASSDGRFLSDLLKDVPRLMSEEHEEILSFCVDVKAIYDLKSVPDNVFWMRLLPKVRGSLLTFFGEAMKDGESWNVCKTYLLRECFPLFVKEKTIRELIVFNFQEKCRPIREFIKEVIDAAEFLQYNASEADVVERVIMNLPPEILAQAALLPRPVSFRELKKYSRTD